MIRAVVLFICLAVPVWADPVVVFAAASLKAPLDEIFEGQDVVVSYGGSGAMAQQIAYGAPADVYISANPQWMDWLEERDLIVADSREDFLGNRLVLVGTTRGPLEEVLGTGPIAMGQVESVPAGIYGKAALEHLGLWDQVAPNAVQVASVTAAARLVSIGEVPLAIVYATDAQAADLPVVATFPTESHPPIVYQIAILPTAADDAWAAISVLGADAGAANFRGPRLYHMAAP